MGNRKFKPSSEGRRTMQISDFEELTRSVPERSLLAPLKRSGGRNNKGRISVRYRGGGHKRRYRIIDFRREKHNVPAKVVSIEYDPNRSARIALLHYIDGEKRYIVAPNHLQVGFVVMSGEQAEIMPGNALPMTNIPLGTLVHNIELKPGKGGQLVRSAGTGAQLIAREGKYVTLRMPSGEMRKVNRVCYATIGQVGNINHENQSSGKAGRTRWFGRLPHVRGVVMNPVDHPHGGGEGRTSGGRHPSSPWGWKTKGPRTRTNKRSDFLIVKRRSKGRK